MNYSDRTIKNPKKNSLFFCHEVWEDLVYVGMPLRLLAFIGILALVQNILYANDETSTAKKNQKKTVERFMSALENGTAEAFKKVYLPYDKDLKKNEKNRDYNPFPRDSKNLFVEYKRDLRELYLILINFTATPNERIPRAFVLVFLEFLKDHLDMDFGAGLGEMTLYRYVNENCYNSFNEALEADEKYLPDNRKNRFNSFCLFENNEKFKGNTKVKMALKNLRAGQINRMFDNARLLSSGSHLFMGDEQEISVSSHKIMRFMFNLRVIGFLPSELIAGHDTIHICCSLLFLAKVGCIPGHKQFSSDNWTRDKLIVLEKSLEDDKPVFKGLTKKVEDRMGLRSWDNGIALEVIKEVAKEAQFNGGVLFTLCNAHRFVEIFELISNLQDAIAERADKVQFLGNKSEDYRVLRVPRDTILLLQDMEKVIYSIADSCKRGRMKEPSSKRSVLSLCGAHLPVGEDDIDKIKHEFDLSCTAAQFVGKLTWVNLKKYTKFFGLIQRFNQVDIFLVDSPSSEEVLSETVFLTDVIESLKKVNPDLKVNLLLVKGLRPELCYLTVTEVFREETVQDRIPADLAREMSLRKVSIETCQEVSLEEYATLVEESTSQEVRGC